MVPIIYRRSKIVIFLLAALASALTFSQGTERARAENNVPGSKAFEPIRAVFQSPRCQNCHIPGEVPLIGDQSKPHAMNVKRGEDGRGKTALRCTNCHRNSNGSLPHTPPGAVDWHLPPPSAPMVFINLSPQELCSNLRDPAKNGGRSPDQLMEHISKDRLVLWGWDPGPERTKPPISHEEFTASFSKWVAAGMPCP